MKIVVSQCGRYGALHSIAYRSEINIEYSKKKKKKLTAFILILIS